MITVSACMIVKNEGKVLRRCLDSLKGIYDELIIVDTGSSDDTKEISFEYTDKVFDFEWVNDFSKARNFAISKATCDYIYVPDADEVLDEENRIKFMELKKALLEEIDIVQMRYVNQLSNGTVYNFDCEYRPKLYKRLRTFSFIEPVHEMVRLTPVVYDSEIDIIHMPENNHSKRDIAIFEGMINRGEELSDRLADMYARELIISGDIDDFVNSKAFFEKISEESQNADLVKKSFTVLAKCALLSEDCSMLLKYATKGIAEEGCSEICTILGEYFEKIGDYKEAAMWYFNARYETEPEIGLIYQTKLPLLGLSRVYRALDDIQTAEKYEEELAECM